MSAGEVLAAARAVADDRTRGAAALASALAPILVRARAESPDALDEIARLVRAGQPVMAGLHHLVAAALADRAAPGRLAQALRAVERAPAALARLGAGAIRHEAHRRPLRLVTWSGSGSVAAAILAAAPAEPLQVTLGEGRPAMEGTRLALDLSSAGVAVEVLEDGAVTTALPSASAVVIGADAVGRDGFINKAGSLGLAAAAQRLGVPVLVLATRDKYVRRLPEIPPGHLFERVPLDLVSHFVTESAVLAPEHLDEIP
ncbi:MAG: hypothetical protein AB7H88_12600 [Vicinamibacterales bacterium]